MRTARAAARSRADHPDGVVLVGVLKGALVFLADLAARCRTSTSRSTSSRSRGTRPTRGRVRILQDVDLELAGRDVVLVEDLVDTGLTLAYLLEHLAARGPRRVEVCTLLDRPARRIVPLERPLRRRGDRRDVFVLGYGLHLADLYRNLPVRRGGRPRRAARTIRAPTLTLRRRGRRPVTERPRGPVLGCPRVDPEAPVIPMSLVGVRVEVPIEPADRAAP